MEIFLNNTAFDESRFSTLHDGAARALIKYINHHKQLFAHLVSIRDQISNECPINRYLGLEIELENVIFKPGGILYLENNTDYQFPSTLIFRAVEDHSLRNNGYEFVSRPGLTGQEILFGVKRLLNQDGLIKDGLQTSYRTSVHVHMNVLDLTVSDLKKIVFWYLLLEPIFFSVSGNRNRNIFCVPLLQTLLPVFKLLNISNQDALWDCCDKWQKYCAFNIKPIAHQGTIEFRHHKGSCDPAEIEDWIIFLSQFIESVLDGKTLNENVTLMYQALQNDNLIKLIGDRFSIPNITSYYGLEEHISNVLTKFIDLSKINLSDISDEVTNRNYKKKTVKNVYSNESIGGFFIGVDPSSEGVFVGDTLASTLHPSSSQENS